MMTPDNLVNSLIVNKDGQVKRVIRDDGDNGLWVSHPAIPNQMERLTREAYRESWGLYQSSAVQEGSKSVYDGGNPYKDLHLGGYTFDEQKTGPADQNEQKININQQEEVPTVIKGAIPSAP